MQTRRAHPRIYVEVPTILSNPNDEDSYDVVTIQQLGRGGCLVKGLAGEPPEEVFNMDFVVGGKYVSVVSKVLYEVDRGGDLLTGMKFMYLNKDSLAALDEYIGLRLRFSSPPGGASNLS